MKKQTPGAVVQNLWRALEILPTLSTVKEEWKNLLNDEFNLIESLLFPTDSVSRCYPRRGTLWGDVPLQVIHHGDGDFVAVCEDSGDRIVLQAEDVIVYRFDTIRFGSLAARLLGLIPAQQAVEPAGNPLTIGFTNTGGGLGLPVFMLFPNSSADLENTLTALIAEKCQAFIALTATSTFWSKNVMLCLRNWNCDIFAMQSTFVVEQSGEWVAVPSIVQRLAEGGRVHTEEIPLDIRSMEVLMAMLNMNAIDSDSRRTADEIAQKANGAVGNSLKSVMAKLKSLSLVDSKGGRSGGSWLSEPGRIRATKIRSQSAGNDN